MNRQRLILFILVIIFAIAVVWSYSAMPRLKTAGTFPNRQVQPAKTVVAESVKKVHTTDDGSRLKIGLLDNESPEFKGYRRNIFKPVFVDEATIAKQKSVAIKPPPPKIITPPALPLLVQPETAPLARFTFLGFLKKGSVKTIFLAKGNEILLVKRGDKVAGRYEATEISDQTLTLTVTDTGDKIVIPLLENQPLSRAR